MAKETAIRWNGVEGPSFPLDPITESRCLGVYCLPLWKSA